MEFLEGRTLGDLIDTGPIAARRVISIAAQMARRAQRRPLEGHHRHRDLKPENIFLLERDGEDDFVKIEVDFGIAKVVEGGALGLRNNAQKLTQAGMVLGTPEYMARRPSRRRARRPTTASTSTPRSAASCTRCSRATSRTAASTSAGTLTKHVVFEPVIPPRKKLARPRHPAAARRDRREDDGEEAGRSLPVDEGAARDARRGGRGGSTAGATRSCAPIARRSCR